MTNRWHRAADLAGLPGMPKSARSIRLHGAKRNWISEPVPGDRRGARRWLESSLPTETQAALCARRGEDVSAGAKEPLAVDTGDGRGEMADARLEIVTAFETWLRPRGLALVPALKQFSDLYRLAGAGVSAETYALVPSFSWNTLQRWRAAWRDRGILGLVPGAGGRGSTIDADPDFRETVAALVLANPDHITARHIARVLRARFSDRAQPGIDAIRRWVRAWRARNRRALSAVSDPDGHRSRRMPAFGDAAGMLVDGLNALWELDSTLADVMCVDGKRYALVAGIDVWSRRAKGVRYARPPTPPRSPRWSASASSTGACPDGW